MSERKFINIAGARSNSHDSFETAIKALNKRQASVAELADIRLYLNTAKNALNAIIPLCAIIHPIPDDFDMKEVKKTRYEYTLAKIYDILKPIVESSSFIKEQLTPVFEEQNESEQSVQLTRFTSQLLDKWQTAVKYSPNAWSKVESLPSECDDLPYHKKLVETVKRAQIIPHASEKSTKYYDSKMLVDPPLTIEKFLNGKDCEDFFGKRNNHKIPTLFGSCNRSIIEDAIDHFLPIFVDYIKHPDFEKIGFLKSQQDLDPNYRFTSLSAYQFYFFAMLTKLISVFNIYVVELIDYVYDVMSDGFEKIKQLAQLKKGKYSDVKNWTGYKQVDYNLQILDQLKTNDIFNDLRDQMDGDQSAQTNQLALQDRFMMIIMGKDRTEMGEETWKQIITKVKLHHPIVEQNNDAQLAPLLQVCDGMTYCIEHATDAITKISKLADRDDQTYCEFYEASAKINQDFDALQATSESSEEKTVELSSDAEEEASSSDEESKKRKQKKGLRGRFTRKNRGSVSLGDHKYSPTPSHKKWRNRKKEEQKEKERRRRSSTGEDDFQQFLTGVVTTSVESPAGSKGNSREPSPRPKTDSKVTQGRFGRGKDTISSIRKM